MTQPPQPPPTSGPPSYGPPPSYGGNGTGIAVTTKFLWLQFIFFFIKPKVSIDGQELPPGDWGRRVIPVAPGQHQVDVYVPYFLPSRVGPAAALVDVPAGQTVELEYRAPVWAFSPGSLGAPPQKYNGMAVYWVLLAVVIVLILCCCGVSIFGNS